MAAMWRRSDGGRTTLTLKRSDADSKTRGEIDISLRIKSYSDLKFSITRVHPTSNAGRKSIGAAGQSLLLRAHKRPHATRSLFRLNATAAVQPTVSSNLLQELNLS